VSKAFAVLVKRVWSMAYLTTEIHFFRQKSGPPIKS